MISDGSADAVLAADGRAAVALDASIGGDVEFPGDWILNDGLDRALFFTTSAFHTLGLFDVAAFDGDHRETSEQHAIRADEAAERAVNPDSQGYGGCQDSPSGEIANLQDAGFDQAAMGDVEDALHPAITPEEGGLIGV